MTFYFFILVSNLSKFPEIWKLDKLELNLILVKVCKTSKCTTGMDRKTKQSVTDNWFDIFHTFPVIEISREEEGRVEGEESVIML